jgi:chromosome segregation ATPase
MRNQLTATTFFGRIGNFFRRGLPDGQLARHAVAALPDPGSTEAEEALDPSAEPRTTFLRPWVKRDQAIDQLQNGIATLSDLMGTIRQTLEKNSDRQDELLNYLSQLPEALVALPESNRVQSEALKAIQTGIEQQNRALGALPEGNRVQGEALKAIQIGIEQQNAQQNKLANVLERMDRDSNESTRTLDVVRERVDGITMHEEAIGQSLQSVGAALRSVSATSEASAHVLENLQANICSRDNQLERVIRRQNTRFTTMLAVAIVMSMAALTGVVVFGYLGYEALQHMPK